MSEWRWPKKAKTREKRKQRFWNRSPPKEKEFGLAGGEPGNSMEKDWGRKSANTGGKNFPSKKTVFGGRGEGPLSGGKVACVFLKSSRGKELQRHAHAKRKSAAPWGKK